MREIPFAGVELTSQRVRGLRGTSELPGRPAVACNSDSEILLRAALQTVKTVVCAQRNNLDVDKFPMFSIGWTWQEFCRDLDPCWSEWRVVTMM